MVRDYDLTATEKYKLVVDTQIPGKTEPGQWETISYNWFGTTETTDETAIEIAQKYLEGERVEKPEALISGSLFELPRKKGEEVRRVKDFEHPKEQPA